MKEKRSEMMAFRTTESTRTFLEKMSTEHSRPVSDVINLLLEYFKQNPPKQLPIKKK